MEIQSTMQIDDLDLSGSLAEHKAFARQKANKCQSLIAANACTEQIVKIFKTYQLGDLVYDEQETKNRLSDYAFWYRRIRKKTFFMIGQIERALGHVSKRKAIYCGDVSLEHFKHKQSLTQAFMDKTFLENEEGLSISLADIAKHNISNPTIRRHELMVRIRGFEEIAQVQGHSAVFTTITTPSRMHANHSAGMANPNYDGSSVQDAQLYLNHIWQLSRAKLERNNIKPYGFRVVEPHHDGTPHWHLLLFMPNESVEQFKSIIHEYALLDSPNEKGALKYRVNFVDIDASKGTAAGYIAKYVAKNVDGHAIDTDKHGTKASEAALRTQAWSRANNIRQFQQIGGPSVTVWRELRRLKTCDSSTIELSTSHQAADSANWAAFCLAMNAVGTPRSMHALAPAYQIKTTEKTDFITGEIHVSQRNRYQEVRKPSLVGIVSEGQLIQTRLAKWRAKTEPPSRETSPHFVGLSRLRWQPWTCVNNCTD